MSTRQIIALGGGGFLMEPENPLLDQYILDQAGKSKPSICFLPTASGDAARSIVGFYAAYNQLECTPSHVTLFGRTPDLRDTLLSQDIVYVGGGNTKSMLALWREWELDVILREAWEAGIVLAGVSAGAICWFEQGITDSVAGRASVLECLGFLKGSCCPHYDGEAERRPAYFAFLDTGEIQPGYALDNGVAVHYVGDAMKEFVSSRPKAMAYGLEAVDGIVHENPISPTYLGG